MLKVVVGVAGVVACVASRVPPQPQLKGSRLIADSTITDDLLVTLNEFSLRNDAPTEGQAASGLGAKQVGIQLEEATMEKLEKDLSSGCGKRFGKDPRMQKFSKHDANAAGQADCQKLEGHMCATNAAVIQGQLAPDGRKLKQTTKVGGQSCLPKECTNQSDLQVLARFMHGQTKDMMPGQEVQLKVDCSKSGGSTVDVAALGSPQQVKSAAFALTVGSWILTAVIGHLAF